MSNNDILRRMLRGSSPIVVLCVAFCAQVFAWHDMGHIMIAEIARRKVSPAIVAEVDKLTDISDPYFQGGITRMPYSSIWMDYVKDDTNVFDTQHYLDIPVEHDNVVAPTPDRTNIKTSLENIANTLIFSEKSRAWGKGLSMMMLLHFIGDMHQPLHAAELYANEFPNGDEGGNRFKITYKNERGDDYTQLHPFFDACGGEYVGRISNPVDRNSPFVVEMNQNVDALMKEFPESEVMKDGCPAITSKTKFKALMQSWIEESNDIARWSYGQLVVGQTLTEDFVKEIRKKLRERIAIGGYRLACLLPRLDYTMRGTLPSEPTTYKTQLIVVSTLLGLVIAGAIFYASGLYRKLFSRSDDKSDILGYGAVDDAVNSNA